MKRRVARTARLATVLKQMHEIENIRLNAARTLKANLESDENRLIEAMVGMPTGESAFYRPLSRRLDAASKSVQAARLDCEKIEKECLEAIIKHSTMHRLVGEFKALLDADAQRRALADIVETFLHSSVRQASENKLQARPVSPALTDNGGDDG